MKNVRITLDKYRENKNKLLSSYNESLKNDEFKEFVSKIKLPDEELCKYTSLLEESCKEYNHCMNCKNINGCKNQVTGYAYLPELENNKLKFGYKGCKFQNKMLKDCRYLENIYAFDEPKAIKEAQMKNIFKNDPTRKDVIDYLIKFYDNYQNNIMNKGLFLHGSFGSGKTYLISAMFNELAKDNIKSAIIFWPGFLTELKGTFNKYNDDYNEMINKVKRVPLLLIDDIGAENMTAWVRDEVLCPILQYRMDEKLPTFITSNFDKKGLENHLSNCGKDEVKTGRIMQRIDQLTLDMELISKNLRK